MTGTGDGNFSPYLDTTRGMLVTILWRLEGEPAAKAAGFTDVDAGAYYAAAVNWAAEHKIVDGYGDGKFGPNDPITREQLVTIFWRYAGSPDPTGNLSSFSDAGSVSDYAKEAMVWAVAKGLIEGSDGKLLPQSNATRAQVAAILMRYCQKVAK